MFEKAIAAFRAEFFTKLANISDRQVQFGIAEELGLPIATIQAQIDNGEAYAQLSKDFELVKEHTVTVSPTLIFNEGRQRLNGNVGYRVIEANIRELISNPPGEQSWC
jgi:predicted DsbA family dithiol-disulfide isomerase